MAKSANKSIKTTFFIPPKYIEALNKILDKERILKSHQVELALKAFFERYRPLLQQEGVDLWQ
jgi:hypothetical protein